MAVDREALLALDYESRVRDWAANPLAFAADVKFEADERQAKLIASKSQQILVNCSRQWGKSTTVALIAAHHMVTIPDSAVIITAPALRQSKETLRKVRLFLRRAGAYRTVDSAQEIELANHSRILALPGTGGTTVGFSAVTLLMEDEAAIVPDELFKRMRPMLATSRAKGIGRHILMSTPFGKRGHFYEQWSGDGAWERHEVRAVDCPRIPADFLEEERVMLGPAWFAQEYCCEFNDLISSFFDPAAVNDAFVDLPTMDADDNGLADIPALVA